MFFMERVLLGGEHRAEPGDLPGLLVEDEQGGHPTRISIPARSTAPGSGSPAPAPAVSSLPGCSAAVFPPVSSALVSSALVSSAVVLSLPFQPVCRDDCPGLCPECGTLLAQEPGHRHDRVDPRWATLQDLAVPVMDRHGRDDERRN